MYSRFVAGLVERAELWEKRTWWRICCRISGGMERRWGLERVESVLISLHW